MPKSLILRTATRYLLPLILLFSFFALFRGHNNPGGGFVGGLLAATAFALYSIAYSEAETRQLLHITPQALVGWGLLLAILSALLAPIFTGNPFMKGLWLESLEIPTIGKLGTPFLFDVGVYLTVLGVVLLIVFSLTEDGSANDKAGKAT